MVDLRVMAPGRVDSAVVAALVGRVGDPDVMRGMAGDRCDGVREGAGMAEDHPEPHRFDDRANGVSSRPQWVPGHGGVKPEKLGRCAPD